MDGKFHGHGNEYFKEILQIMKEKLPEYILAGKTTDLSRWVEHAANLGILWCYEHERNGRNRCSSSCIRGGGCAIAAESALLMVLPGGSMSTFDDRAYEGIVVVIPSKKLKMADRDSVRSLVSRLMSAFCDSSVVCFESGRSPEGEVEWKPFNVGVLDQ